MEIKILIGKNGVLITIKISHKTIIIPIFRGIGLIYQNKKYDSIKAVVIGRGILIKSYN